ncbi:MAG: UvrD-helicase domain-containing protein [Clostridiales bacterium]|nr:UvrD-helicase domain-containing protein [Clostridiales bacterium]
MSSKQVFTSSQQNVIDFRGKNMLVSASAGTGKTTVMIERIVSLIEQGADVSQIVVVTFTNLAASEMKARLAAKLSEKRNNPRILEQIEKLDSASICTLHSFCSELLKNYFYVVDIDPAFTILDSVTVATLRKNTLDDVFAEYFSDKDDIFRRVYKIFATHRREENFKNTLLTLYDFSRCLEDFSAWYEQKRNNFLQYSDDNPIVKTLLSDVVQSVQYYKRNMHNIVERSREMDLTYTDLFEYNLELLHGIRLDTLEHALFDLSKVSLQSLPRKAKNVVFDDIEENIRQNFKDLKGDFEKFAGKYATLCRGENMQTLWEETKQSTVYTDKLVEIVEKFDQMFFQAKKQRGGVDFNDLEHLTLQLLNDDETLAEIRSRYKLVFVDEYQDTNPVQEAIISRLASPDNLFMVGDVKQSIYGFRGCEPSIFVDKYTRYLQTSEGRVEELNDNFRSNSDILEFVNVLFDEIMTMSFGKVDYSNTAQLQGATSPTLQTPSTRVDLILKEERESVEIDSLYDITADAENYDGVKQGEHIAKRIKEYVGMAYRDKDGNARRINYGDIVILMRGLTGKAIDIYNTLVAHNIPVSAAFKVDGFSGKEVRDLVTLFRVIDNPYNDVYLIGACLSSFGGFTERELGYIRLDTEGRIPFYERLQSYTVSGLNAEIVTKIKAFLEFLRKLRFYSRSAKVDELALYVMNETNYHLYVQSLPNGGMRLNKLYAFIDSVKDASYAQTVDKFLSFVDETDDKRAESGLFGGNTVRLMTMHASKGLEFPVVILAGVESQFNFDNNTVETNTDLGLAVRYYNFQNMRVADTLGATACGLFNKIKQREEEMRLLYVAMTRAKFALDMVGTISDKQLKALPKLPTRAMSHLDWLMIVVQQQMKQSKLANGLEINVIDSLPNNEDEADNAGYLCEQTVSIEDVERKLSYRYQYADQTLMPSKVVSSALDKEYLDLTDEPQAEHTLNVNNERNFIGTAYHKVYQYVDYNADESEIRALIDSLVRDGKIERKFADNLDVKLIHSTLNNPDLRRLLCGGKVYHEVPFMLYVPYNQVAKDQRFSDDVILQGVIDLLVINKDKATVIDFKYTSRSDKVQDNYTAQLNSYKLAVQRICGINDVSAFVMSIEDNKLISM